MILCSHGTGRSPDDRLLGQHHRNFPVLVLVTHAAYQLRRHTRRGALAFRQIVSSFDPIVIQKGKEMIALFMESFAHRLFVWFAAGRLQYFCPF